jgi:rhodanese-related sulfurtransferase
MAFALVMLSAAWRSAGPREYILSEGHAMVATISKEELKSKIDRGDRFMLVETLAEDSFEKWHLPRAVNVPTERVRELAHSRLPDKNAEIVVYCGSSM